MSKEIYRTQVRVPEELFEKARVLASIYGVSFNQLVVDLLDERIRSWEADHGGIPTLPSVEK